MIAELRLFRGVNGGKLYVEKKIKELSQEAITNRSPRFEGHLPEDFDTTGEFLKYLDESGGRQRRNESSISTFFATVALELENLLKDYIGTKLGMDVIQVQGPLGMNFQWKGTEIVYSSYLKIFR